MPKTVHVDINMPVGNQIRGKTPVKLLLLLNQWILHLEGLIFHREM